MGSQESVAQKIVAQSRTLTVKSSPHSNDFHGLPVTKPCCVFVAPSRKLLLPKISLNIFNTFKYVLFFFVDFYVTVGKCKEHGHNNDQRTEPVNGLFPRYRT